MLFRTHLRLFGLILCVASLPACVSANMRASEQYIATKEWPRRDLNGREKAAVQAAVQGILRDPESARFQWLPYVDSPDKIYCGLVNSKNGFGGYSGFTIYAVGLTHIHSKPVTSYIGSDEGIPPPYGPTKELCARNGYWAY